MGEELHTVLLEGTHQQVMTVRVMKYHYLYGSSMPMCSEALFRMTWVLLNRAGSEVYPVGPFGGICWAFI